MAISNIRSNYFIRSMLFFMLRKIDAKRIFPGSEDTRCFPAGMYLNLFFSLKASMEKNVTEKHIVFC